MNHIPTETYFFTQNKLTLGASGDFAPGPPPELSPGPHQQARMQDDFLTEGRDRNCDLADQIEVSTCSEAPQKCPSYRLQCQRMEEHIRLFLHLCV